MDMNSEWHPFNLTS